MVAPDVNPAVNLRPERAAILSAFSSKDYPNVMSLADGWLNSRPADALVALVRNNALLKQRGSSLITIGVSVPTSGKTTQAGEAVLQGVNMAVQEANKEGGIAGKSIAVEVLNDQNDRALAIQAATAMLANAKVLGVIGPVNSSSALAAADIYNGGLVHIAPTASDDRLADSGPWTFRMVPKNSAQGRALARIAKQRGFIRIPVYYDPKGAYSKGLADAFQKEAEKLGISVVPFEYTSGSLPEQAAFDVYQDSPAPDAAFISGDYTDVARIAKSMREQNITVPLIAGDSAYSQALLQDAGAAVEGLTLVSYFHASATSVGNTLGFVKAFGNRYGGGTPNARAAQAYDATRTLLEAIKRAKTQDRAGVKAALNTFTAEKPGPGVTSKVQFKDGGIVGRPFVVIQVVQGKLVSSGTVQ
jgi:branched-chain amino acid transport system substrate-binding protein